MTPAEIAAYERGRADERDAVVVWLIDKFMSSAATAIAHREHMKGQSDG